MSAKCQLIIGDAVTSMKSLADASVDSVVCDPPYGLGKQPDMAEVVTHWLAGDDYEAAGAGFMGKSWDSFVPGPAVWKEALRVPQAGRPSGCVRWTAEWLVRLVTPPGGVVLDPFMGSGSTGVAAVKNGFNFIGCDITPEYVTNIAIPRIKHAGGTGTLRRAAELETTDVPE